MCNQEGGGVGGQSWTQPFLAEEDPNVPWCFPGSSAGKESICSAGDPGSTPALGRSPGEGKGYSLQYPGLENSMDYIVHGVTKSWTRWSNFHFSLMSHGKSEEEVKEKESG